VIAGSDTPTEKNELKEEDVKDCGEDRSDDGGIKETQT
jgi:hypothetical protein